jgi:hypothetical protein
MCYGTDRRPGSLPQEGPLPVKARRLPVALRGRPAPLPRLGDGPGLSPAGRGSPRARRDPVSPLRARAHGTWPGALLLALLVGATACDVRTHSFTYYMRECTPPAPEDQDWCLMILYPNAP